MLWYLASFAVAQVAVENGDSPQLDAQHFRPSLDGRSTLWTDDSEAGSHNRPFASALFHYTRRPLVYAHTDGRELNVVSDILQGDLMGGFAYDRMRVGAALPVYFLVDGHDTDAGAGVGDLDVEGKYTVVKRTTGPGLAISGRLSLPTSGFGTNELGESRRVPLGASGPTWEISAIADQTFGRWLVAANIGLRGAPEVELENVVLNDALAFRAAGAYRIGDDSGVALELAGNLPVSSFDLVAFPVEAMLDGYTQVATDLQLRGGVGTALSGGIGAPDYRVLLGFSWRPGPAAVAVADPDGDGVVGTADRCPTVPEDFDGVEDEDGCPEAAVAQVTPPPTEEPSVGVVYIQVVDAEGKPIDDAKVSVDGQVLSGGKHTLEVPVGALTVEASAPGYAAPDVEKRTIEANAATVVLVTMRPTETAPSPPVEERIDLRDSVYFDVGKATIQSRSFALLNEVVATLKARSEITKLRVEGHTDSRGGADANLDLSQRRAEAVRAYFVSKGVESSRLQAVGFGESKPLQKGETEAAWTKNRRVDFFIAERTD